MLSESMVLLYLDTPVLFATWKAVLRMAPIARNYDLEKVKQAPVDVCYVTFCCEDKVLY